MMKNGGNVLLIPLLCKGNGIGHAVRVAALARSIGTGAHILVEGMESETMFRLLSDSHSLRTVCAEDARCMDWDLVICDHRITPPDLAFGFSQSGSVVGIDEGGIARRSFAFLVDTLPSPDGKNTANAYDSGFLTLPSRKRQPPSDIGKILVSFGGEDPSGLTGKCIRAFIRAGVCELSRLTVVRGPLAGPLNVPSEVSVLDAPRDLREHLADYDLVITSFGLTAYEARSAGVPVVLCNPTRYHTRLSRCAGFTVIGTGEFSHRKLRSFFRFPSRLIQAGSRVTVTRREPIHEFLSSLDFRTGTVCPLCGNIRNNAAVRLPTRTFFRCRSCGILFQKDFTSEKIAYGRDYFFDEYRNQYGKTYLEDFTSIKKSGSVRIGIIDSLIRKYGKKTTEKAILDIGCAFGPFLDAARDLGFEPFGTDVSQDAVDYVAGTLKIPAVSAVFPEFSAAEAFGRMQFHAVSMWYVIEHFQDLTDILKSVNMLLPAGGIFAFSTPNASGISAKKNMKSFCAASPRDHFSLWEPVRTNRLLSRYGFRVRKIRITGHHPERFPWLGQYSAGVPFLSKILYKAVHAASVILRLGDTFEVYAVKVRDTL